MPHTHAHNLAAIELVTHRVSHAPHIEAERQSAINQLLAHNRFMPVDFGAGPHALRMALRDNRLMMEVEDMAGKRTRDIPLALQPFRRLIKDYFMICESYGGALSGAPHARIEALDMARRGLHDEGARLLQDRLNTRVTMDHDTARGLFTLLCVLHIGVSPIGLS